MNENNECNIFEHTEWPTRPQAAEWISLIANAVTITIPVTAGLKYLIPWPITYPGFPATLLIAFLVLFGGLAVIWSWWLVFLGARGAKTTSIWFYAAAAASSLCGFGLAGIAGTLLGRFMS